MTLTDDQALQIIETSGMDHFGVRFHHEIVKAGDELGVSYNSIDDQDAEQLDGICALTIQYDGIEVDDIQATIDELKQYAIDGGCIVLVGGTSSEYGNDEGEIIISDAVALAVI